MGGWERRGGREKGSVREEGRRDLGEGGRVERGNVEGGRVRREE
jgi:hypothetical protein